MEEVLNTPRKDVNSSSLGSDNTTILDNVDSWDILNFAQPVDTQMLTDAMDINCGADEGYFSFHTISGEQGVDCKTKFAKYQ